MTAYFSASPQTGQPACADLAPDVREVGQSGMDGPVPVLSPASAEERRRVPRHRRPDGRCSRAFRPVDVAEITVGCDTVPDQLLEDGEVGKPGFLLA